MYPSCLNRRTGSRTLLLGVMLAMPLLATAASAPTPRPHAATPARKARHVKAVRTLPAASAVSMAPRTGPESPYARAAAAHGEARRAELASHAANASQPSP